MKNLLSRDKAIEVGIGVSLRVQGIKTRVQGFEFPFKGLKNVERASVSSKSLASPIVKFMKQLSKSFEIPS